MLGLAWAVRPKPAPITVSLPTQYWVAVMSQGTPFTRQAFWFNADYGEMEEFIRAKLDEEYQITSFSR